MHVCILTQYYPPEIGAPQRRLSDLAQRLVARGHEVTVLTAMPNYPSGKITEGYGGLTSREVIDGVNVIRAFIYPTQRTNFIYRLTNYFSFVFSSAIIGTFRLKNIDFLLVESPPLFLGLSGYLLSQLKSARFIFNVSDLWPESAVRLGVLGPESILFKLALLLEKFLYNKSWLITGQSKSILADIKGRFEGLSTFHLSNGVDVTGYGPGNVTDAMETSLAPFVPNRMGKTIILYAGLHGLAQGLDHVLNTARKLQEETQEVHFVFVGDGPQKKSLITLAERQGITNVSFLEPRPASEIPPMLASADIVIVPLKMYIPGAVPSKLYEAMASAKPVILIAQGEAADIVNQQECGLVVTPGDEDGLAATIMRLHKNPELRKEMGRNGRHAAEIHYDRALIATRFIDYLEKNL